MQSTRCAKCAWGISDPEDRAVGVLELKGGECPCKFQTKSSVLGDCSSLVTSCAMPVSCKHAIEVMRHWEVQWIAGVVPA